MSGTRAMELAARERDRIEYVAQRLHVRRASFAIAASSRSGRSNFGPRPSAKYRPNPIASGR
jgi:hypothetical protein